MISVSRDEVIAITDMHPDAKRLLGAVGNNGSVEVPGTVRRLRVVRPLLIDVGAGIAEHAMVEVSSIPGHGHCGRGSRTAAHRGTGVGISCELDIGFLLNQRKHFGLDELGIEARHCVVLKAALTALRITAAVGNGDRNHDGHAFSGDQIIQCCEEHSVRAVSTNKEWRNCAWHVLPGNIDGDLAAIGLRRALHEQFTRVCGIWLTKRTGFAGDAGVDLAVGGLHSELDDLALGHALIDNCFWCGGVRGPDDEVAILFHLRNGAIGELFGLDVTRNVGVACGRLGPCGLSGGGRGSRHLLGQGGGADQEDKAMEQMDRTKHSLMLSHACTRYQKSAIARPHQHEATLVIR